MPQRSYIVNYDIRATTEGAVKAFEAMKSPMMQVGQSMAVIEQSISRLLDNQARLKEFGKLTIKPTIDLTSYKNALATMEQNAKETAIRVRRAIDASLGGSQKDFVRAISNLGTDNFKEAKASLSGQIAEVDRQLKNAKALYDREARTTKISSAKRRQEIEAAKNAFGDEKTIKTVANSVNRFSEKLGLGKLFTYDAKKGQYLHPMADAWKEFSDRATEYRERLMVENDQIAKSLESRNAAIKAGAPVSKLGVGNLLGFGLDEIERTASAIGSLTQGINDLRTMAGGGVIKPSTQSTKAIDDLNKATKARNEYQESLKKIGAAPKAPKTYPNADEIARLQSEVSGLEDLKKKQAAIVEQRKAIAKIKRPEVTPTVTQKQMVAMYDRLLSDKAMEDIARGAKEDVALGNVKKADLQNHIARLQQQARESAWRRAGFRSERHFADTEKIVREYKAWESNVGAAVAPTEDYTEQIKAKEAAQKRLNTLLRQKSTYDTRLKGWQDKVNAVAKPAGWVSDTEYARLQGLAATAEKTAAIKQEAAKPTQMKFDIIGNFSERMGDLVRLGEIIATIPKEILINVGLKSSAQQTLLILDSISKLKSKTVTVNVEGNYKTAVADLKALQGFTAIGSKTGKGKPGAGQSISVNAKLNTEGAANEVQQFIQRLQALANEKFVKIKAMLSGDASMSEVNTIVSAIQKAANEKIVKLKVMLDRTALGQGLQQALANLQQLSNSRRVRIPYTLAGSDSGYALNQAIRILQELASSRRVRIPYTLSGGDAGFTLNQVIQRLQALANTRSIKIKAVIGNAPTFASGTTSGLIVKVRGIVKFFKEQVQAAADSIKNVIIRAKVQLGWATGQGSKQAQLKELSSKLPMLKIKLDISEAEAVLDRLIKRIRSLSPQTIRVNANERGGTSGVRNTAESLVSGPRITGTIRGGSGRNESLYDRTRRAMYPFTGNTSFGARTPVAFDMVKGMGMMYGIGGAMSIISDSFGQAVQYQNTMETARAILEQNYKGNNFNYDFNDMVKKAREVAVKTKFTAAQTSDAVRFMAMAGLDIPMIKASIAPIADLAVIGDNDLGEVADKITNIQTAFKLGPDKMRHLADAMAKTMTSTNTDMMMLAESMQYAAPMAHLAGASVEDTLAMIGIMGNSGIQASMAGTTLRMMYQNIIQPNKKQKAMWDKLGISLRDDQGNVRNLMDVMSDLAKKTKSQQTAIDLLGGEDKATGNKKIDAAAGQRSGINVADAVSRLFRVTASAGAGSIVESIQKVRQLADEIKNSNGLSQYVSEKKQGTISGLWHQVTSAFTEDVVKVFESNEAQDFLHTTLRELKSTFSDPQFVKTLTSLFNLIKDVGRVMGWFVKQWVNLYNLAPGLVKMVVLAQAAFTQFGYLATPFVQFIGLLDKLGLKMAALTANTTALTASLTASAASTAANTTARTVDRNGAILSALGLSGASTSTLLRNSRQGFNDLYGFDAMNRNANLVTYGTAAQQALYAKYNRELVKYESLRARLQNTAYGSAMPGAWWSMAYTNPERVAMRSRASIRAEQKILERQEKLRALEAKFLQQREFQFNKGIAQNTASWYAVNAAANSQAFMDGARRRAIVERNMGINGILRGEAAQQMFRGEYVQRREWFRQQQEFLKAQLNARSATMTAVQRTNIEQTLLKAQQREAAFNSALLALSARRRSERVTSIAALQRGVQMGKFSGWKAIGAAFNVGMTAASFAGLWTMIKNGFMTVALNLSKVLGLIISPAGAVVAALAALGAGIWWYKSKVDDASKELQDAVNRGKPTINAISDRIKPIQNQTFAATKATQAINDVRDAVTGAIWKSNPQLRNTRGFSDIYKRSYFTDDREYNKAMFEQHIAPMAKMMFGREYTYTEFQRKADEEARTYTKYYASGNGVAPTAVEMKDTMGYYQQMAEKAAVYQMAYNSPQFKKAQSQYTALMNRWNSLSSEQKMAENDNIRQQIVKLRDQFGGWATGGLKSVADLGNLRTARAGDIMATSDAQKAMWDFFNDFLINRSSAINSEFALGNLRNYVKGQVSSYDENDMGAVMSSIQLPFRDAKGEIQNLTLAFNGITPVWGSLLDQFKQYGIKYGQTETEKASIIQFILDKLNNLPGMQGIIDKLGGITDITQSILNSTKDPYQLAAEKWMEKMGSDWYLKLAPWYKSEDETGAESNKSISPYITKPEDKPVIAPLFPQKQEKKDDSNGVKVTKPFWMGDNDGAQNSFGNLKPNLDLPSTIDQSDLAMTYPTRTKNVGSGNGINISFGNINLGGINYGNEIDKQAIINEAVAQFGIELAAIFETIPTSGSPSVTS